MKDIYFDHLKGIADSYLGGVGGLESAFSDRFGTELPDQFSQGHRSLVVAEPTDAGTVRIVRYLAEVEVPINVATVQHFQDSNDRGLLAQVYLIEPEEVRPRGCGTPARSAYRTVNELQDLAHE